MKVFVLALLLTFAAMITPGLADQPIATPLDAPIVQADWQEPQSLPPRFRNHCVRDPFTGRAYCADHCGFDYQFYFCSRHSFGCCRVGFGYCDWNGLLRCHP